MGHAEETERLLWRDTVRSRVRGTLVLIIPISGGVRENTLAKYFDYEGGTLIKLLEYAEGTGGLL